ncbi:threonine aldolase family protein [uncultured Jatrophihabitans sp.]|uniref:threonine aldolase family protein n=1 Tax=uncultured Jatrophihabitans sp. TaxID=1610747 RepID=UPI0035CC6D16
MDDETRARRERCHTFIHGDGLVRPVDLLASIGDDVVPDVYGDGGVVADLEADIAELLGFPAAVFLPSGTMAQAATLRVHADQRARRTVLWHPTCHLATHEGEAYSRVHALTGRAVGGADRLLTRDDLDGVAEPPAAVLWELPQRDLGGQLPDWDDLGDQLAWAGDRGAATHLDGARLWEASAGYGRTPAEIAGRFDTAYVSFYKGIGALPGCCVVGSEAVVGQVREWRKRLGGTLFAMWPNAATASARLPERLAEMPARLEHARAIAAALAAAPGVRMVPDPPQTPMMHLLFGVTRDRFAANARRLAEEQGVWAWPEPMPTGDPDVVRCELSVGRATCLLEPARIAEILDELTAS